MADLPIDVLRMSYDQSLEKEKALKKENKAIQDELTKCKGVLSDFKTKVDTYQEQIKEVQESSRQKQGELEEKLATSESAVKEKDIAIETASQKNTLLEEKVSVLERNSALLNQTIEEKSLIIQQNKDELKRLDDINAEFEEKVTFCIENHTPQLKELNDKIEELTKQLAAAQSDTSSKELIESIQKENNELSKAKKDLEEKVNQLEGNNKQLASKNKQLESELAQYQANNKELTNSQKDLENKLNKSEENNKILETELKQVKANNQDITQSKNQLDTQLKELEKKSKLLESKNNDLESKLNQSNQKVNELKSQYDTIQQQSKSNDSAVHSELNKVKKDLEDMKDKYNKLDSELKKSKNSNIQLQNTIDANKTQLDDLKKKLEKSNEDIMKLNKTIANLNTIIKGKDKEINDLKNELAKLKEENMKLNNKLRDMNGKLKDAQTTQKKQQEENLAVQFAPMKDKKVAKEWTWLNEFENNPETKGKLLLSELKGHTSGASSCVFSTDCTMIATMAKDGGIIIHNIAHSSVSTESSSSRYNITCVDDYVCATTFTGDDKYLVCGLGVSKCVNIYYIPPFSNKSTNKPELWKSFKTEAKEPLLGISVYHSSEKMSIVTCEIGSTTLIVYDINGKTIDKQVNRTQKVFYSMTSSPYSRFIGFSGTSKDAFVFEPKHKVNGDFTNLSRVLQVQHNDSIIGLGIGNKCDQMITISKDETMRLWAIDVRYFNASLIKNYPCRLNVSYAMLSEENLCIILICDNDIYFMHCANGEVITTIENPHNCKIIFSCIAGNGRAIATIGEKDNDIKIWMIPRGMKFTDNV